jgi:hypothetical protein
MPYRLLVARRAETFSLLPPNAHGVTVEARHRIAVVAFGDEAEHLSFYQP